jgi:uncharacterized protein (TIGR02646 family)
MIRIERSAEIPEWLLNHGAPATSAEINQAIYGHSSVKEELIFMQDGKCAFCERRVNEDGDVEHFRPKKAVQQALGQPLERPGYYWLAYEWTNLVLACSACNQREKRNLFPLENPENRARSSQDDLEAEQPLFIDPAQEDPEEFIGWRAEIPFARSDNRRAMVTIEALGLDRPAIANMRQEALELAQGLAGAIRLNEEHPRSPKDIAVSHILRQELDKLLAQTGEFSAMLRANIVVPPMQETV